MRLETLYKDPKFFSNAVNYIQNRLTELKFQVEFSGLLKDAMTNSKIIVNDIDKLVRVGNDFKAIFELKVRRMKQENYIYVNRSQWNTLRLLSEKLNVPVFYLIKLRDGYQLIKLRFTWKEIFRGKQQLADYYIKIPYEEGLTLNKEGLILDLADILKCP